MARVLLCWEMGAGFGHLSRQASLAKALTARGHTVLLAVCQRNAVASMFPDSQVFQAPVPQLSKRQVNFPCTYAHLLFNWDFTDAEVLADRMKGWSHLVKDTSPDIAILDHSPTAALALRLTEIPSVRIGTGFECPPSLGPWPVIRRNARLAEDVRVAIDSQLEAGVNQALRSLKGAELSSVDRLYDHLQETMLLTYAPLDRYARSEDTRYWGIIEESFGTTVTWPSGKGPRIFAYLRNHPHLTEQLSALSETSDRCIVYLPDPPAEVVNSLNSGITLYREPVLLSELLQECELFVGYGGHGTVAQCLLAGVPLVICPQSLEQDITASGVEELGAGLRLLGQAAQATSPLSDAIQSVVQDERYRSAATRFREQHQEDRRDILHQVVVRIESYS